LLAGCLIAGAIGCGGNAPKSSVTAPVSNVPKPLPVPVQPAERPPAANVAAKLPLPKDGKYPKAKPVELDPFADEDPKNLFEVAEIGPTYTIAAPAAAADSAVIVDAPPSSDSTRFEIVSTGEASGGKPGRPSDVSLPEGFVAVPSFGHSDHGLPWRIRDEKTGGLMALVPGGPAIIGSHDGPPETQPEFTPFLETYYIDVTEVTLGQYGKFRDDMKRKKNSRVQPPLNDGQDLQLPALGLPWGVAQAFAHWAGKELPTEAEFEKAARGPNGFRTPWGNGRAVWSRPRTPELISPVASFSTDQSVYGAYDLAGNAQEWCSDWYSDTAHQEAVKAPERLLRNWAGPKKASVSGHRVVKGNGPDWSAWHREGRAMGERHANVGFRCVLRIKLPASSGGSGD
jgi:formylglycine-generating enzyme required for sulfatase activity